MRATREKYRVRNSIGAKCSQSGGHSGIKIEKRRLVPILTASPSPPNTMVCLAALVEDHGFGWESPSCCQGDCIMATRRVRGTPGLQHGRPVCIPRPGIRVRVRDGTGVGARIRIGIRVLFKCPAQGPICQG